MLVRLRREFVAITMVIVGVALAGVLGSALYSSVSTQRSVTDALLRRALSGEAWAVAQIGDETGEQSADIMLAVTVDVTRDGTTVSRGGAPIAISGDTLQDIVSEAMASESDSGKSSSYPVAWMRVATDFGWRIALADTYTRDAALRAQALNGIVIFVVAMGALFVVMSLLSRWALRPVEEAWERQRRFVSDASHELKTPLAVILANVQILESEPDLGEEPRRWVRSTAEEAGHMRSLVEDLLTLARADERRAEGATGPVAREDVCLTSLVEGCALEFDAVSFERGCSIECDLAPDVHVEGDPSQLGRLVRTLLDNATKYAERGSVVTVRLRREGRRATLAVNNRGEVIDPEDLPHLFERFYRTDRARARTSAGGFGLGLAIAKSIAEAHGGKISVTSDAADGTTFTVAL